LARRKSGPISRTGHLLASNTSGKEALKGDGDRTKTPPLSAFSATGSSNLLNCFLEGAM
jgi:hypothetical protein